MQAVLDFAENLSAASRASLETAMRSFSLVHTAPLLLSAYGVAPSVAQDGRPCQTQTLAAAVPTDNSVALHSYSYCGGALNAEAYIQNVNYDKIVTLYYTNGKNESTLRSAVTFGYQGDVASSSGWELWTSSNPEVYMEGITQLLNITFQATNIGQTFVEQLHTPVVASGPPPPTSSVPAPYASPSGFSKDITKFLTPSSYSQIAIAKRQMLNNINSPGTASGIVIASPSRSNPDYYYSWVRDASLTMDVVQLFYAGTSKQNVKKNVSSLMYQYAAARSKQQLDSTAITGLGEPKFNVDNTAFTGPWGRPQNDGAATAVISLLEFAEAYIEQGGNIKKISRDLFDSDANPTKAPILKDLRFVAANWSHSSFDLWEEEQADHFYTRMVQWRALSMGASFATRVGRSDLSSQFSSAADDVAKTLPSFWDPARQLILYENGPVLRGKSSYKDIAVVLGVVHGYSLGNAYGFANPQVLTSALKIATSFLIFPIANTTRDANGLVLGIPIGRYPEDIYDGLSTSGAGNPWYLCTAAMAELFYRASKTFQDGGNIYVNKVSLPFWKYFAPSAKVVAGQRYSSTSEEYKIMLGGLQGWGDAFIRTIKYYTPGSGHLSEEFNRDSGAPQGAVDLTWSYASLIKAATARAEALGDTSYLQRLANIE